MTTVKEYSFDETNSQLMFQDGLAQSTIFSEGRRYEIGEALGVKVIDNFIIFAPIDIEYKAVHCFI